MDKTTLFEKIQSLFDEVYRTDVYEDRPGMFGAYIFGKIVFDDLKIEFQQVKIEYLEAKYLSIRFSNGEKSLTFSEKISVSVHFAKSIMPCAVLNEHQVMELTMLNGKFRELRGIWLSAILGSKR